ncbi:MAG: hypothetical protein WAN18_09545 [Candidatus Sulfotelmatobacter sp.]
MNFISGMEGEEIHVELKYCERCGGLWLRRQDVEGVYCASCQMHLAAMPNPEEAPSAEPRPRRKVRLPGTGVGRRGAHRQVRVRRETAHSEVRIEYLEGVAAMEVRL